MVTPLDIVRPEFVKSHKSLRLVGKNLQRVTFVAEFSTRNLGFLCFGVGMNFQDFVIRLTQYWTDLGCLWSQPYDSQMGAGTFHPHTFLKGIGPEPWRAVYVQPCRRPVDGRYGKSPYRFQHYYQLQVILKPSPANIVDLFLGSLQHMGVELQKNDVGLLEDDWKGPTLGAWGLGWEVRANGQEVTQFTYFQQLGGLDIEVVSGEITYGLERLYMYAFGIEDGNDIPFNDSFSYRDIFYQNEFEFSHFNFTDASIPELLAEFGRCEESVFRLCEKGLVLPAYDDTLRASHTFNLLDARGAVSVTERQRYIGRVRECARKCAESYRAQREKLNFPMAQRLNADPRQVLVSRAAVSANSSIRGAVGGSESSFIPGAVGGSGSASIPGAVGGSESSFIPGAVGVSESSSLPGAGSARLATTVNTAFATPGLKDEKKLEVVFELGVEEMPPRFQQMAQEAMPKTFSEALAGIFALSGDPKFKDQFDLGAAKWIATSRRLGLVWDGLPLNEPDRVEEMWGPAERVAKSADGGLSPAGQGFLRKNGLEPNQAGFVAKPDGSGVFLHAKRSVPGRKVAAILGEIFQKCIEGLEAPLVMRWLPEDVCRPFVRPVRWILALANGEVLPLQMFGLESGNHTHGTRVWTPGVFSISSSAGYFELMDHLGIETNWSRRRSHVFGEIEKSEFLPVGTRMGVDEGLLDKVTGLSETPVPFLGKIKQDYLRLPKPLVTSVLKEHMNYFVTESSSGDLAPLFVGTANYRCKDFAGMIAGAEQVVGGRLADGAFYYDTDLETDVDAMREKLKSQTFQEGMGNLFEKTERVGALAQELVRMARSPEFLRRKTGEGVYLELKASTSKSTSGRHVQQLQADDEHKLSESAAHLAGIYSKADLRSGCVQEFPDEMQGVMGGILVRHQWGAAGHSRSALSEVVGQAIAEHYEPKNASAELPSSALGRFVSLADKVDSLCVSVFARSIEGLLENAV